MTDTTIYPDVFDASLVGTYPATANAGGGYVWDEVLEYRVWCCPSKGAEDIEDGSDYYYSFASYADAREIHPQEERITEWPVTFLSRPRRHERTIPDFLSPDAPSNRLDILRGSVSR